MSDSIVNVVEIGLYISCKGHEKQTRSKEKHDYNEQQQRKKVCMQHFKNYCNQVLGQSVYSVRQPKDWIFLNIFLKISVRSSLHDIIDETPTLFCPTSVRMSV